MEEMHIGARRLEYETGGEGRPFVFLHGLGGSVEQIHGTYEPIEGVQLITLNQQGHGNSEADWAHFGFDALADDVDTLMAHLGIDSAVFAGISMGAAVTVNMALRHPGRVEGMVLIRNAWKNEPQPSEVRRAFSDMADCLHEGGLEAFKQTPGWQIVKGPSAYTRNAFEKPFSEEYNIRNYQKYKILPAACPFSDANALRSLSQPVTVIACRGDLCHPYGLGLWYRDHIPGAAFVEIPSKDADPQAHKSMINCTLKKLFCE